MSMRVETTLAAEALTRTRTVDRAGATALRSSFATALSGATGGASAPAGTRSAANPAAETADTAAKAPKGEKTRAVEGKDYLEIISGPRNGMFINRSGNARDGEAFVRVEKDGRDVHIYGSGKDRHTVVLWHNDDKSPTAGADRVPEGEVSAPVEGKLYDEITAGPRNGMFLNRSGNARDGLPFVLVRYDHSEDHVYGSGDERQVIRCWDEGYEPTPAAPQPGTTGSR